jgi:hypothetical protein
LAKASSIFDEGGPVNLDGKYDVRERLPRTLTVEFRLDPETKRSIMLIDGKQIGDSLSDNTSAEDHYRFHDIFHLSFMTYLGWSPVMRGILKSKRRSNKAVDENEDGARAAITEEAISAIIFNVAEDNDFFR